MTFLAALLVLAHTTVPAADLRSLYEQVSARVAAAYDTSRGGFVAKDGMLSESAVELALLHAHDGGDAEWSKRAAATIEWSSGLMDTLGGGFYHGGVRQGRDQDALTKRVDSNARRLELLIEAAGAPESRQAGDAARVADFMERVLLDGRGGFVSAQVGDRELEPAANGVALHAWLLWSGMKLDRRARDFALRSLDRVWETCWQPMFGLLRRDAFGDVTSVPMLTDQVEMGRALVLASRWCGRESDWTRACALGDLMIARYEDPRRGGFRTSSVPRKNGSIQNAPRDPGENARAALFLEELAVLTGDARYREAAARTRHAFEKSFNSMGLDAADWGLALRMSMVRELPPAPHWPARDPAQEPARRRSVTFKTGRF
jgi:uncharacterized protein YyaL (SSP411 family)